MKQLDVIIIGAGTSGLTARREVAKKTQNYIVIDDGPLGTTCARVGCMPSKVLIQVANDFDRRRKFEQMGIGGGDELTLDRKKVMEHVRSLRDRFVRGVKSSMPEWEDKLVRGRAKFVDPHTVEVDGETYRGEEIILAVGSRPVIPAPWNDFHEYLIDTDSFFEQETLPDSVAVIGLGVIGSELGQALARLGVKVHGFSKGKSIGGLTDPKIQDYVVSKFGEEIPLHLDGVELKGVENGKLQLAASGDRFEVDQALVSVGRRSNVDRLALDTLGITLDSRGLPEYDRNTLKLKELPHIFLPGDSNADRPILHEAADEGIIAGHNAVSEETCFKRRTSLGVTFTDPSIGTVGKRYSELKDSGVDFVTGEVSFEGQGRSIVKLKEQGLLHVYVDRTNGEILGAELQAPDGEHLAHLLAWAMSAKLTVYEAIRMPFYHPVVEEGLRTALRNAAD